VFELAPAAHPFDSMDEVPVAEVLPGLYRAVLDAVAQLEGRNRRVEAAAIRKEATRVYSRAWTPDAARRLRALRARADRITDPRVRSRYDLVIETVGHHPRRATDMDRHPA
jgi:hypothetical protein